jgi:hypothetical protein
MHLMSPEYVQPYVTAQKNDERNAEAIAEAATRPTMRFVELKSEAQLDARILHPARSRRPTDSLDQPAPRRSPGAWHRGCQVPRQIETAEPPTALSSRTAS